MITMKTKLFVGWKTEAEAETIDWREVYDRLLPRIFHYFCYKTGNMDVAEDLTAITLEKAWTGRISFHSNQGKFESWVCGIARRTAIDYFREHKVEVELDSVVHHPDEVRLDEEIEEKLSFEQICQILQQFPEREREIISLKYGAELTNREIARVTGLSESNVGTILHRLVSDLRRFWEQKK